MSLVNKVSRAGLTAGRSVLVQQSRNINFTPIAVAIPARTKIPQPQRGIMAAFIYTCIWFTPVWVLTHLKEYRNKKKE